MRSHEENVWNLYEVSDDLTFYLRDFETRSHKDFININAIKYFPFEENPRLDHEE